MKKGKMKRQIEEEDSIASFLFSLFIAIPARVGMFFLPTLTIVLQIKSYYNNVATLFPTIIVVWSCVAIYIVGLIYIIKRTKNRRKNEEKKV